MNPSGGPVRGADAPGTTAAVSHLWLHTGCGGRVMFGLCGGWCTGCGEEDLMDGGYFKPAASGPGAGPPALPGGGPAAGDPGPNGLYSPNGQPAEYCGPGAQPPSTAPGPPANPTAAPAGATQGGTSIMTPGHTGSEPAAASSLAALADWIQARLDDENCDRQAIAEDAAARLRELARPASGAQPGAPSGARTPPAGPGRMEAAAMLRAAAGLIETRDDIPQPYATVHFILTRHHPGIAGAVAAIASAVPGQWQAKLRRSAGYGDSLDLTASTGPKTEIQVSVPAEAVCTEAGTTTVTTWEPSRAITPFLGGTPVEDQRYPQ